MSYEHEIDDVRFLITVVGNYTAAHSIALDPYSRYRLKVMDYIMILKKHGLRLGDHEPDRTIKLVAKGVVSGIFNDVQNHLIKYHEDKIQTITDYFHEVSDMHPMHPAHAAQLIATKMRSTLNDYEQKMNKMKAAIRKCLAMLYKIHMKDI